MATTKSTASHGSSAEFFFDYKAKRGDSTAQKITISLLVISLPVLYVSLLHVPPSSLYYDTMFWFIMSNTIIIIVATDSGFLFSPSSDDSNKIYDEYLAHSKARRASLAVTASPLPNPVIAGGKKSKPEEEVRVKTVTTNDPAEAEKKPEENVTVISSVSESTGEKKQFVDEQDKLPREIENKVVANEPVVAAPVADQKTQNKRSTMKAQRPERSRSEIGKRSRAVFENNKKLLRRSATEMKEKRGDNYQGPSDDDQYATMSDEELNRRVEEFIRTFKEIRLMELSNA